MSDLQWAGMMLGDEAYAGSRNFYHLEDAVRKYYGYRHLVPTHQGRGAEHILSKIAHQARRFVPGNMYFTTTRLHQELAGGTFVDVIIPEGHDPTSEHPFKGNIDLRRLEKLDQEGRPRADPVHLRFGHGEHGRRAADLDGEHPRRPPIRRRHGLRIMLDATRAVENAYFIQQREAGLQVQPGGRNPPRVLLLLPTAAR